MATAAMVTCSECGKAVPEQDAIGYDPNSAGCGIITMHICKPCYDEALAGDDPYARLEEEWGPYGAWRERDDEMRGITYQEAVR